MSEACQLVHVVFDFRLGVAPRLAYAIKAQISVQATLQIRYPSKSLCTMHHAPSSIPHRGKVIDPLAKDASVRGLT